jgi:hypothetical protein
MDSGAEIPVEVRTQLVALRERMSRIAEVHAKAEAEAVEEEDEDESNRESSGNIFARMTICLDSSTSQKRPRKKMKKSGSSSAKKTKAKVAISSTSSEVFPPEFSGGIGGKMRVFTSSKLLTLFILSAITQYTKLSPAAGTL